MRKVLGAAGGIVVLGLAWMLGPAAATDVKDKAEAKTERAKEKADAGADRAKESARDVKETVKDKAHAAKEKVTGAVRKMERQAEAAETRSMQQALRDKGHDPGPIDGVMGPRTRAALTSYQKAEGLEATGRLDPPTAEKLNLGSSADDGRAPSASPSTEPGPTKPARRQTP
jgi:peptidoglycan hydrolase-like protein with peptidoglycan-binding domain